MVQINAVSCIFGVKRLLGEHRLHSFRHAKVLELLVSHSAFLLDLALNLFKLFTLVGRHWIDHWIIAEHRNVWILILNEADCRLMVWTKMHASWPTIIEMRKRDLILCANLVSYDNLVDIVELVPVFIFLVHVTIEWLKFRATWDGHVESLSRVERLLIEEVEVVLVGQIRQKLIGEAIQVGHHRQG